MSSVYELYLGGPRQQNTDWAIFPAATFSSANEALLPPANKTPVVFGASRTLDFSANDQALSYFYRKTLPSSLFVQNDVLGAVVVPAPCMFFGLFYRVNSIIAGTGGAFKLRFRAAAQDLVTALDPHVLQSGFVPYNGAGVITTLDTVTATLAKFMHYFATPDIVDMVITTLPTPNVWSTFSITITPVYFLVQSGKN